MFFTSYFSSRPVDQILDLLHSGSDQTLQTLLQQQEQILPRQGFSHTLTWTHEHLASFSSLPSTHQASATTALWLGLSRQPGLTREEKTVCLNHLFLAYRHSPPAPELFGRVTGFLSDDLPNGPAPLVMIRWREAGHTIFFRHLASFPHSASAPQTPIFRTFIEWFPELSAALVTSNPASTTAIPQGSEEVSSVTYDI